MDNTNPNQQQNPQNPQNPLYPPQNQPYGQQPPAGGNQYLARVNAFRRQRPVLAGVAALIAVCVVCAACTGIVQGITGAGQTAGAQSNAGGQSTARINGPTATPRPTATATATPKPKAWTTVKTFSGTATTSTDTFAIPDGAHIVWSCKKSDSFGGNFAVDLYQDDGTLVDLVANTQDDDSGTYTLHADPSSDGKYYLKVDTYSEKWTINVQVYQ